MTLLGGPLLEKGFPIVTFDVRHHGESRGAPYITARHYRDDITAAVRSARDLFPGRPCVLVGHSMGGATGVLAVAEGAPVAGLITIGSPADMWGIWAYYLNRKGLPGSLIVKLLKPFWRVRAGVPWPSLDPIRRAGDLTVPVLILHGADDESVPPFHARLLGESAGVAPRILAGEGHTDLLESEVVVNAVVGFLTEIGGSPSAVGSAASPT
jgi:pimeloyl-ACP methyl ester carboxylesterase